MYCCLKRADKASTYNYFQTPWARAIIRRIIPDNVDTLTHWPNCTEYFNSILHADDTTLSSTIRIPSSSLININNELAKVYDWLAGNKLSLNIRKTKYVVFHTLNKRIEGVIPDLEINGIPLDKVKDFNFLGLQLNENMSWKPNIDSLSNKLAKCTGVLNR